MKTVVIKRDGCQVVFDKNRIKQAVMRAATATGICDDHYCAVVASVVEQQLGNRQTVDIHEIQDAVENQLMAGRYKDLAEIILPIAMIGILPENNVVASLTKFAA